MDFFCLVSSYRLRPEGLAWENPIFNFFCFPFGKMLNPPLSLLSDDLLASIVEQLANLPFEDENLKNLSLVDRVFTQSCQKYIFRGFILGGGVWCKISNQLKKKKKFLDNKPS